MIIELKETKANILDGYSNWYYISKQAKKVKFENNAMQKLLHKSLFYIIPLVIIYILIKLCLINQDFYMWFLPIMLSILGIYIATIVNNLIGDETKRRDVLIKLYKKKMSEGHAFYVTDKIEFKVNSLLLFSVDKKLKVPKEDILIVETEDTIYVCYKKDFLFKTGIEYSLPLIINKSIFKSKTEITTFYASINNVDVIKVCTKNN